MEGKKACCFLGHRKIKSREILKNRVYETVEKLITEDKIEMFLFGSKSEFNELCVNVVTSLKVRYPHIERIYVRAENPEISESYRKYLLRDFDDTYFPAKITNAGKAAYVERNCEMIDKSDVCVMYYDESYLPPKQKASKRSVADYQPKSGTKAAYEYANKKKKKIVNVFIKPLKSYFSDNADNKY